MIEIHNFKIDDLKLVTTKSIPSKMTLKIRNLKTDIPKTNNFTIFMQFPTTLWKLLTNFMQFNTISSTVFKSLSDCTSSNFWEYFEIVSNFCTISYNFFDLIEIYFKRYENIYHLIVKQFYTFSYNFFKLYPNVMSFLYSSLKFFFIFNNLIEFYL